MTQLNFQSRFWSFATQFGFQFPHLTDQQKKICFPNSSCIKLDGKLVAERMREQLVALAKNQPRPHLTVILAGENPASEIYVTRKVKMFESLGFSSDLIRLSSSETTRPKVAKLIEDLNRNPNVHGILLQLPLPHGIPANSLVNLISPEKDVDGFHPYSLGKLSAGQFETALPCTPLGVMVMLGAYGIPTVGARAVVIGRSQVVGRPMSILLMSADATVSVCHRHTRTEDLVTLCNEADIIVVAAGKPNLVTKKHVRPGAVVIDVGINRLPSGKVVGDTSSDVCEVAGALTPVPGGVGPMTVTMLAINTALLCWNRLKSQS